MEIIFYILVGLGLLLIAGKFLLASFAALAGLVTILIPNSNNLCYNFFNKFFILMKVKHLKKLGFESRAILSKKGGDIFICNDKAFKRILEGKSPGKNIDSYNISNNYFHYVRTSSLYPEHLMNIFFSSKL